MRRAGQREWVKGKREEKWGEHLLSPFDFFGAHTQVTYCLPTQTHLNLDRLMIDGWIDGWR